jgi:hypothetical protein
LGRVSARGLYNGNNAAERASGWEDQRHRFLYSLVWAPEVHIDNAVAKALLGNWQISAIATPPGAPYASPSISGTLSACTATDSARFQW